MVEQYRNFVCCPNKKCDEVFAWDWCQDTFYNPLDMKYHVTTEEDNIVHYFCKGCGCKVESWNSETGEFTSDYGFENWDFEEA